MWTLVLNSVRFCNEISRECLGSEMDVGVERGESCSKCHPLFSPEVIRINIADSFCERQRFPTASVVDATSGAWMWRSASRCLYFFVFLLFLLERRGRRRTSFAPLHSFGSIRGSQPGVSLFFFSGFHDPMITLRTHTGWCFSITHSLINPLLWKKFTEKVWTVLS